MARIAAPAWISPTGPLGSVAVGDSIEKKTPPISESPRQALRYAQTSKGKKEERRVGQYLTNKGKNHYDAGMSVSCAKEILSQRILHISAGLVHQRCQQKVSSR
jgi:hypothetical protein